ncbi:hypothetical protein J2782_004467 [Brucella pseudogrignonensis]|uniref:Uncharacterized protein n=1 Tax=Brucella pseudogrignonensis TaxID=419475 RepID=A0ABU1MF80_9HYPH|nr:hypothetical protein [Brucella pseudogrignonensis]
MAVLDVKLKYLSLRWYDVIDMIPPLSFTSIYVRYW